MDEMYVVIVTRGEEVVSVLGPRGSRLEAKALSEVLRLGMDLKATVHPVRDATIVDLHGPEILGAFVDAS